MLGLNKMRTAAAVWLLGASGLLSAPQPALPQAPIPGRAGGLGGYPQHPPADLVVLERGKGLYSVNCGFCHGADARGGEGGPNLLRSELVLNDQHGEGILPTVRNGRPEGGMPKFDFTAAQVADIATYLHSLPVGGRDRSRQTPISILTGNAADGKVYFAAKCASCHSATGDLQGIASKIADPMTLQQTWIMPNAGGRGGRGGAPVNVPPTSVTVSLPSGQKVEGRLVRIDDFLVTLTDGQGTMRTFPRKGDQPPVAVHEPLEPHLQLLPVYTDKDIHDLTAYLVTLK
jgi:cytochrome c oxidase cbb3-type subunit 3